MWKLSGAICGFFNINYPSPMLRSIHSAWPAELSVPLGEHLDLLS